MEKDKFGTPTEVIDVYGAKFNINELASQKLRDSLDMITDALDDQFGDGYAIRNPNLIAACIQAHAQHVQIMYKQIRHVSIDICKERT